MLSYQFALSYSDGFGGSKVGKGSGLQRETKAEKLKAEENDQRPKGKLDAAIDGNHCECELFDHKHVM